MSPPLLSTHNTHTHPHPPLHTRTANSKKKQKMAFPRAVLALVALLLVVAFPVSSALKDTIKNRMKLADQYIDENPVEDGVEGMAKYVSCLMWL